MRRLLLLLLGTLVSGLAHDSDVQQFHSRFVEATDPGTHMSGMSLQLPRDMPMDVNPYVTSSKHEFHRQESYVNGQPVYEKRHERRYENGRLVHEDGHERGNPSSVHSGLNAGGHHQSSSSSSRRSSSSSSSHGQHLPVIHGEFYQGEGSAGAQRFSTRSGSSSSQNAYGSGAIVRPSYRSGYSPSQD